MDFLTGARLTIDKKRAIRSVALELSKATWLIARQRDWPQNTQTLDLDCSLSVREPEDTLGCELSSWRK